MTPRVKRKAHPSTKSVEPQSKKVIFPTSDLDAVLTKRPQAKMSGKRKSTQAEVSKVPMLPPELRLLILKHLLTFDEKITLLKLEKDLSWVWAVLGVSQEFRAEAAKILAHNAFRFTSRMKPELDAVNITQVVEFEQQTSRNALFMAIPFVSTNVQVLIHPSNLGLTFVTAMPRPIKPDRIFHIQSRTIPPVAVTIGPLLRSVEVNFDLLRMDEMTTSKINGRFNSMTRAIERLTCAYLVNLDRLIWDTTWGHYRSSPLSHSGMVHEVKLDNFRVNAHSFTLTGANDEWTKVIMGAADVHR